MPNLTMKFRWFKPRVKTGVIESGNLAGNYIWGMASPFFNK